MAILCRAISRLAGLRGARSSGWLARVGTRLTMVALCGALALGMSASTSRAAENVYSEYAVKGAFLTKFAMFVEWPEKTFEHKGAPLIIGILGEDPFGPSFEAALAKEAAGGRTFVLKRFKSASEAAGCQILFVGASEKERLPQILDAVRGRPVLTVADHEGFAHRGGMINFIMDGGKVRFEVNAAAVEAGGLKMSAKLLQVARAVPALPEKGGR
jgi:hypothetical protein